MTPPPSDREKAKEIYRCCGKEVTRFYRHMVCPILERRRILESEEVKALVEAVEYVLDVGDNGLVKLDNALDLFTKLREGK